LHRFLDAESAFAQTLQQHLGSNGVKERRAEITQTGQKECGGKEGPAAKDVGKVPGVLAHQKGKEKRHRKDVAHPGKTYLPALKVKRDGYLVNTEGQTEETYGYEKNKDVSPAHIFRD